MMKRTQISPFFFNLRQLVCFLLLISKKAVIDEIAEEPHFACASLESMQMAFQKEEEEEKDRSLCAAFLFSFFFYKSTSESPLPLQSETHNI